MRAWHLTWYWEQVNLHILHCHRVIASLNFWRYIEEEKNVKLGYEKDSRDEKLEPPQLVKEW